MENSSSSKFQGQRKVVLKITFSEELNLNNLLHVVSGSLPNKNDLKLLFVSNKFVLTKNNMYVSKG